MFVVMVTAQLLSECLCTERLCRHSRSQIPVDSVLCRSVSSYFSISFHQYLLVNINISCKGKTVAYEMEPGRFYVNLRDQLLTTYIYIKFVPPPLFGFHYAASDEIYQQIILLIQIPVEEFLIKAEISPRIVI